MIAVRCSVDTQTLASAVAIAVCVALAGCGNDPAEEMAQGDGGSTADAGPTDGGETSEGTTGGDSVGDGSSSETASSETGTAPDTCSNGVGDPGEEAVDCGGPCEVCPGVAFADDPLTWSVPNDGFPSTFGGGNPSSHTTMDLDGDGRADLVSTHDGAYEVFGGAANPHWRVHLNTGDGFADEASQWSVPNENFASTFGGGNPSSHTTMDLDGDGRADLVSTHDGDYEVFGGAANPHWRVFRNVAN